LSVITSKSMLSGSIYIIMAWREIYDLFVTGTCPLEFRGIDNRSHRMMP
jgi:hypothetical protein